MIGGHPVATGSKPVVRLLDAAKHEAFVADIDGVEAAGVDLSRPAITSCGSGVTAAILNLALTRVGKDDHSLYDGSWSEWGQFPTLPVATGET